MEINMAKCKLKDGQFPPLKWNGMRRTSEPWSCTQQDPELWSQDGNCLVYLHSKSDSPRSPSFKLSFSDILAAKCQPLINEYIDFAGRRQGQVAGASEKRSIELYIPPMGHREADQHLFSMRNLFAWILRRSLVGDHLGPALVQLLYSMQRYRSKGEDNVGDLMNYLDEEGYLDFAGQPSFALGILYFAEHIQLNDLYIRAFSHCVGMTDSISANAEYMKVSLRTRNLIRRARDEMYNRITRASRTLQSFLEIELSEAHLGLHLGPRAHLAKFRQFLLSHYNQEISIVPGGMLESSTLEAMREDFEALYDLLVDDHCDFTATSSASAGGICTLQAVQSFEVRNQLGPLAHALPLLPELDRPVTARRLPWVSRAEKYKAPRDLVSHTALIAASNWRPDIAKNPLVQAYRLFEQDSILQQTTRAERISLVDARKVRWILVYTTYQVLRSVTKRPSQLDTDGTPYHLSVYVDNLPPWDKTSSILPDTTGFSVTPTWESEWSTPPRSSSSRIDIKPDIDYYAITHKEHPPVAMHRRSSIASATARTTQVLARSTSVTRALTRSYTFRKSIRRSKTAAHAETPLETATPAVPRCSSQKQAYHEIVVRGYGNGTNDVNVESSKTEPFAKRTDSTASQSNSSSASARNSNASTEDVWDLPFKHSPPASPMTEASEDDAWCEEAIEEAIEEAPKDVPLQYITRNSSRRSLTSLHPIKTALSGLNHAASVKRASTFERRNSFKESFSFSGGIARSHSLRRLSLRHDTINSPTNMLQARECDIDEQDEEQPWGSSPAEADDWDAMEAFLDGSVSPETAAEGALGQYKDLGGLTAIA